jgi:hypothetical protein
MKFRTKKVVAGSDADEVQVQLSVPLYGVLRDVQEAFFGLCVEADKATLSAMMEADRERSAGHTAAGTRTAASCWAADALTCNGPEPGRSKAANWCCRPSPGRRARIR